MKIFVPTDFSEGSKKAVHFAAQLAENFGAHMILAHAWYPSVTDAEFDNFNAVVEAAKYIYSLGCAQCTPTPFIRIMFPLNICRNLIL